MNQSVTRFLLLTGLFLALAACGRKQDTGRVVVAYVTSWSDVMPDPQYMTHVNYAFGHVDTTFDAVRIDNPDRLRAIAAHKKDSPKLNVMLSVGGWGSGRFSEMAGDEALRKSFCASCARAVADFGLDGIDIDWEYPTSDMAGISASPDDTENFTLLLRDLREALGPDKFLTIATSATARYIDYNAIVGYLDFVNVMAYDMSMGTAHHSGLYPSAFSAELTSDGAVKAHLAAGVPPEKLVMGMPFYGRGTRRFGRYVDYKAVGDQGCTLCWDEVSKVPFVVDSLRNYVFGFENARSLAIKCEYIVEQGLHGGMYWDYSGDNEAHDLARTVADGLLK